jgi:hypothetical protein
MTKFDTLEEIEGEILAHENHLYCLCKMAAEYAQTGLDDFASQLAYESEMACIEGVEQELAELVVKKRRLECQSLKEQQKGYCLAGLITVLTVLRHVVHFQIQSVSAGMSQRLYKNNTEKKTVQIVKAQEK